MQMAAFLNSLPVHTRSQHRASVTSTSSAAHTQLVSVAKPPPRAPQSDGRLKPEKRKERKHNSFSDPPFVPRREITSAELSEKLTRAAGLDLVLEDIARFSGFLKSFLRPKSSIRPKQREHDDSDPNSTETSIVAPKPSRAYKPKSITATNVAIAYTAARGAVDRAMQTLYIHGQSYVQAATKVTGGTICRILSAGHQVFPGLKLDRTRDAVAATLTDGWVPLNAFQWQLADPEERVWQRREARMQQIPYFFRGGTMSDFLNAAGSTLGGVGEAAEKFAPFMARVVTRATFGNGTPINYPKQSKRNVDSEELSYQRERKNGFRLKNGSTRDRNRSIVNSIGDRNEADSGKTEVTFRERKMRLPFSQNQAGTEILVSDIGSDQIHPRDESEDVVKRHPFEGATTAFTRDDVVKVNENGTMRTLQGGILVVAAGFVASAAAIVSAPTAITCSTLIIGTIALSGAKRANATDLQIQARHCPRQSRTVQYAERMILKSTSFPTAKVKYQRFLPPVGPEKMRRRTYETMGCAIPASTGTSRSEDVSPDIIEASSYAVSPSQPLVMSLPVIGVVLHWLDGGAYFVERLIGTVLQRSGVWHAYRGQGQYAAWELLRSFKDNSNPD